MSTNERGVYQSENRGRQLLKFNGMRWGDITPTDIDGIIDYQDAVWIIYEVKMIGKDVPYGQRLAIIRLIQDAKQAGKHGCAMIVEHNVIDPSNDVYLKDCIVREIYTTDEMQWRPPRRRITAFEATNAYIQYHRVIQQARPIDIFGG